MLSRWTTETFGNVKQKIKLKNEELHVAQTRPADVALLHQCIVLSGDLNKLYKLEESYCSQGCVLMKCEMVTRIRSLFTEKQAKANTTTKVKVCMMMTMFGETNLRSLRS